MSADKTLNVNVILIILLTTATGFGLICGLLYAINLDLNSDMVVPGIVAKEVAGYHNFQFFYPAADPYLFTDIYTFHLLPQILSGYNPLVLKLTAYAVFLLIVSIFSLIIYKNSGIVNALIFSALLTNISPNAYLLYLYPMQHVGTLLGAGVLLLLLNIREIPQLSTARIVLLGVVAALIFYSDTLFLILFIVPYILYYLYYRTKKPDQPDNLNRKGAARLKASMKKEGSKIDLVILLLVSGVVLMTLIRTFFDENRELDLPNLIDTPTSLAGINTILSVNLPVLVQSLTSLVNPNLYSIATGNLNVFSIGLSVVFLLVVGYSFFKMDKTKQYLYAMLLLSSAILAAAFIITDWATSLFSARYLVLIPVAVFAIVAMAYRESEKAKPGLPGVLFIIAILALLIFSVPANLSKVSSLDYQPNEADQELGAYLKANNFTYGFSDYWTAHTLTYLSGGDLRIYPMKIKYNDQNPYMNPVSWLTTKRWYYYLTTDFVIIESNNSTLSRDLASFVKEHPPVEVCHFKDYTIYHYQLEGENPRRWFY